MWYNQDDVIFSSIVNDDLEKVVSICKFANWLLNRKIELGIVVQDLKSVMDIAIVIALNSDDFSIADIHKNFKKYFKNVIIGSAPNKFDIAYSMKGQTYHDIDLQIDLSVSIAKLKKKEKEVIRLHILEEREMLEVAGTMGITRTSVYRLLVSAKKKMRDHLHEGGY